MRPSRPRSLSPSKGLCLRPRSLCLSKGLSLHSRSLNLRPRPLSPSKGLSLRSRSLSLSKGLCLFPRSLSLSKGPARTRAPEAASRARPRLPTRAAAEGSRAPGDLGRSTRASLSPRMRGGSHDALPLRQRNRRVCVLVRCAGGQKSPRPACTTPEFFPGSARFGQDRRRICGFLRSCERPAGDTCGASSRGDGPGSDRVAVRLDLAAAVGVCGRDQRVAQAEVDQRAAHGD